MGRSLYVPKLAADISFLRFAYLIVAQAAGAFIMTMIYYNGEILDREGNARKVVNCSCVVVKDWGEESQERSILLNYFQTEQ